MKSPEFKRIVQKMIVTGLLLIAYLNFNGAAMAADTTETFRTGREKFRVHLVGSSTAVNWKNEIPPDQFSPVLIFPDGVNGEIFEETVGRVERENNVCNYDATVVYSAVNNMNADRMQQIPAPDRLRSLKNARQALMEFISAKCHGKMELIIAEAPATQTLNDQKPETKALRGGWNDDLVKNSGNGYKFLRVCLQSLRSDNLHLKLEALFDMGNRIRNHLLYRAPIDACP